jgi:hypothetical protein
MKYWPLYLWPLHPLRSLLIFSILLRLPGLWFPRLWLVTLLFFVSLSNRLDLHLQDTMISHSAKITTIYVGETAVHLDVRNCENRLIAEASSFMRCRLQKKALFREESSVHVRGTLNKQMLKKNFDDQCIACPGIQWKEVLGRERDHLLYDKKVK